MRGYGVTRRGTTDPPPGGSGAATRSSRTRTTTGGRPRILVRRSWLRRPHRGRAGRVWRRRGRPAADPVRACLLSWRPDGCPEMPSTVRNVSFSGLQSRSSKCTDAGTKNAGERIIYTNHEILIARISETVGYYLPSRQITGGHLPRKRRPSWDIELRLHCVRSAPILRFGECRLQGGALPLP